MGNDVQSRLRYAHDTATGLLLRKGVSSHSVMTNAPLLYEHALVGAWPKLLARLSSHPAEVVWSDKCHNTALHLVCRRQPPLSVVLALLRAHPVSPTLATVDGLTPLHFACYCGAGLDVVSLLLKAYVRAAFSTERRGKTALHYACAGFRTRDRSRVIRTLLECNPAAATAEDERGRTPLSLIFDDYAEEIAEEAMGRRHLTSMSEGRGLNTTASTTDASCLTPSSTNSLSSTQSVNYSHSSRELNDCFRIVSYQLRAAYHGSVVDLPNREFSYLHAAVAVPECPPHFIRLVLRLNKDRVGEPDEAGNLPLHVAAAARLPWGGEDEHDYDRLPTSTVKKNESGIVDDGDTENGVDSSTAAVHHVRPHDQHSSPLHVIADDDLYYHEDDLDYRASLRRAQRVSDARDVVLHVLGSHIRAARVANADGDLPYVSAVRAGRPWEGGTRELVEAAGDAVDPAVAAPLLRVCATSPSERVRWETSRTAAELLRRCGRGRQHTVDFLRFLVAGVASTKDDAAVQFSMLHALLGLLRNAKEDLKRSLAGEEDDLGRSFESGGRHRHDSDGGMISSSSDDRTADRQNNKPRSTFGTNVFGEDGFTDEEEEVDLFADAQDDEVGDDDRPVPIEIRPTSNSGNPFDDIDDDKNPFDDDLSKPANDEHKNNGSNPSFNNPFESTTTISTAEENGDDPFSPSPDNNNHNNTNFTSAINEDKKTNPFDSSDDPPPPPQSSLSSSHLTNSDLEGILALATGLIIHQDERTRENAACVLGAVCDVMGEECAADLLHDTVLASHYEHQDPKDKHARLTDCYVSYGVLSADVGRNMVAVVLDEDSFARLERVCRDSLTDYDVDVRRSACALVGALLARSISPSRLVENHDRIRFTSTSVVSCLRHGVLECMRVVAEDDDVRVGLARGLTEAARRNPDALRTRVATPILDAALMLAVSSGTTRRVRTAYVRLLVVALGVAVVGDGDDDTTVSSCGGFGPGLSDYMHRANGENGRTMMKLMTKVMGQLAEDDYLSVVVL